MRSDPAISEYSVFNDTSDDIISVNDFLCDRRQTERVIQKKRPHAFSFSCSENERSLVIKFWIAKKDTSRDQ